MNISFCGNHMDTLADLMRLAEKHNCCIRFGFDASSEREIDKDILKKCGLTDALFQELEEQMTISDYQSTFSKVWFELYDKTANTTNILTYIQSSTYFSVEKISELEFRYEYPSNELVEWLEENDECWEAGNYIIHKAYDPTIIRGFGNEKRVEDFRVYRSGMALKYFSDLVCDYLGEPRINRVY
jgi:hypothetical protein